MNKSTALFVDYEKKTLVITKAFYKKACQWGTKESKLYNEARKQNPDFPTVFKFEGKNTGKGLKMKLIRNYVQTLGNDIKNEFAIVCQQALEEKKDYKPGTEDQVCFPAAKRWFRDTFPYTSVSEMEKAIKTAENDAFDRKVKQIVEANPVEQKPTLLKTGTEG